MGILLGRTNVANQAECVVWGCNSCGETTETKEKLRNHLAAMRREANAGKLYCPYCEKDNARRKHRGACHRFHRAQMQANSERRKGPAIRDGTIRRCPRAEGIHTAGLKNIRECK